MTKEKAKQVIRKQAQAILALEQKVDEQFVKAVEIILACKGRVIVTGMGKSGIIARKIAATLASTGTAALYLHPAEGVHGDLGIVRREDAVIVVTKSGTRMKSISYFHYSKDSASRLLLWSAMSILRWPRNRTWSSMCRWPRKPEEITWFRLRRPRQPW